MTRRLAGAALVLTFSLAGVSVAPSATADDASLPLRAALMAMRQASCSPLRSDPVVEKAAGEVGESTIKWLAHAARAVPVPDPLPLLKDLGYGGSKAVTLSGAGTSGTDAIKALLLEGWSKIPDCSYTDYGVSTLYSPEKNMIMTTVVLAA